MEYSTQVPLFHSCLLCDHYFNCKRFSSLDFKKHLLSKKHLALCKLLVDLKTQKKKKLIEMGDKPSESDYQTIEQISGNGKTLKIFTISNKQFLPFDYQTYTQYCIRTENEKTFKKIRALINDSETSEDSDENL